MAPVAGALLLLFLGAAAALLLSSTFLTSIGWVVVGEATAMLGGQNNRCWLLQVLTMVHL